MEGGVARGDRRQRKGRGSSADDGDTEWESGRDDNGTIGKAETANRRQLGCRGCLLRLRRRWQPSHLAEGLDCVSAGLLAAQLDLAVVERRIGSKLPPAEPRQGLRGGLGLRGSLGLRVGRRRKWSRGLVCEDRLQ